MVQPSIVASRKGTARAGELNAVNTRQNTEIFMIDGMEKIGESQV